ncbi:hypothetical protein [Fusibacillus kribbianus]|uniref:Uncharacterized protein n=1 Tax=Fusibacillus kribbianus TaxID=3044208 RepID=A0AAP4BDX0_9FIRM|nr:hypothetical protein [Ruminococcus sp. YH-rum2234]MDI9243201.1 hypothetical protein [Ruminococcus sp. YH-rum2234]
MFFSKPWKTNKIELERLYKKRQDLEQINEGKVLPGSELDKVYKEIDLLIEGEYAESVFAYYVKKRPALIRIKTGEIVTWDDAFGNSFEKVSKSLRHSLVGLVEGGGRYKIK